MSEERYNGYANRRGGERVKPLATITVPEGDEGTAYVITLPDGRAFTITETGTLYAELAHIIDHAAGDCDDPTCEDTLR